MSGQTTESLTMCSMALSTSLGEDLDHAKPPQSKDSSCMDDSGVPVQEVEINQPLPSCFDVDGEIDLYQEEGSDIGPRCLMESIQMDSRTSDDAKLDLVEAVATFNSGLVHHNQRELEEACTVYESVLYYVYGLLQTFGAQEVPSSTILTLGMQAHNNLGAIAYLSNCEDDVRNNFDAALIFARQLLRKAKHQHLAIASVVSNWCRIHWARGDIEADSLFQCMEEVLRLRSDSLPWYHVDVAASHLNLATAHHASGLSDKAIYHLQQYLEISAYHAGAKLNQVDPIPALIYLLLVRVEDREDPASQDLARALRALQDKRQDQGRNSAEVASVLNYVGTLLFHAQDYANAMMFFQEELRIEKSLDECEQMSLAVTCNNIARTLQEQGKFQEAMVYYQHALGSEDQALHEDQYEQLDATATNLFSTVWYNLGLIHDKLGETTKAIHAFQVSLKLRKVILGSLHPDIACLWYNVGVLQMERGFLNDSQTSFLHALEIRSKCREHQLNDERVLKTMQKLSSLQKNAGNLRGAIDALEQMLHLLQQSTCHQILRARELSGVFYKIAELYHELNDSCKSFIMARLAVEAVEAVTHILLEEESSEVSVCEKIATVEQWALSHLLVGSLLHEKNEPLEAYHVLEQLESTLNVLTGQAIFSIPSLAALTQVVGLLATPQCAPQA